DTKGALSWLVVAGVGVGVFLIYKIASNAGKITNVVGSAADTASAALDELTNIITDPNPNASDSPLGNTGQSVITITEVEAQNRANMLLEAMDRFGTDEERIIAALTGITLADYVLIAEKFGT